MLLYGHLPQLTELLQLVLDGVSFLGHRCNAALQTQSICEYMKHM